MRWREAIEAADAETLDRLSLQPDLEDIDGLVEVALTRDLDPLVRVEALDWLARLGRPDIVGKLLDIAEDSGADEFVRVEALCAAGRAMRLHPGARVSGVPRGTTFLRDPSVELRAAALECLGGTADPSCQSLLCAALDDPEGRVRASAARAIGRIGAEGLATVLLERAREDPDTGEFIEALGELRAREAVPFLLEVASTSGGRQVQAIEALGRLGDDRAVATLGLLARSEDWIVVEAAREALTRIGTPVASAELDRALEPTWNREGGAVE